MSTTRKVAGACALAIALAGLTAGQSGAVSAHAAKTYKVKMTLTGGKISGGGTVVTGIKATGSPFGRCTMGAKFKAPRMTQTWRCRGGSFKNTYNVSIKGDIVGGKGRYSNGTGKYKGIKGASIARGSLSKSTATITGSASF